MMIKKYNIGSVDIDVILDVFTLYVSDEYLLNEINYDYAILRYHREDRKELRIPVLNSDEWSYKYFSDMSSGTLEEASSSIMKIFLPSRFGGVDACMNRLECMGYNVQYYSAMNVIFILNKND